MSLVISHYLPLLLPLFFLIIRPPPRSTLFPYTTLFRSFEKASTVFVDVLSVVFVKAGQVKGVLRHKTDAAQPGRESIGKAVLDRKSTRLNSSHQIISYAVFCLKKKNTQSTYNPMT